MGLIFREKKESDPEHSLVGKTQPQIGANGKGLRIVERSVRKATMSCQGNCLKSSCTWYKWQTKLNFLISNSDQCEAG